MPLKIIGGIIFAFGLVDLIGSYSGLDVWNDWLHIQLPEMLWRFSSYIEIALGAFLFRLNSQKVSE